MQHKNIKDEKKQIIFVDPSAVKSLPVPPCDYVFAKSNIAVPSEALVDIKINPDSSRRMPKMYLNSKLIHFKLDKKALVFQDTGEAANVSASDIKTTARHHRYVFMEPQIPNSHFEKASLIKPNCRIVLSSYTWRTAHAWVYVTLGPGYRYVPQPYNIKFDEGTRMHFVEEGSTKFQVTTCVNLEAIRRDLEERARMAVLFIERNHITFNDVLIFKNTISNTLFIAPAPENVLKCKTALDLFNLKLQLNTNVLPFSLSNFPWAQEDIDVIFQKQFPDSIIRYQIGKYHGCALFYDGNPSDAVRITCSRGGMVTVDQETYHAADYLKYWLSTLGLVDHFEIIKQTNPSTFIFLFKNPNNANHFTLPEIIEILFNDLLRIDALMQAFIQTPLKNVTQISNNVTTPQMTAFDDITTLNIDELDDEIVDDLFIVAQNKNVDCNTNINNSNNALTIPDYSNQGSPYFFPPSPSNDFVDDGSPTETHKRNLDNNETTVTVNKQPKIQ